LKAEILAPRLQLNLLQHRTTGRQALIAAAQRVRDLPAFDPS